MTNTRVAETELTASPVGYPPAPDGKVFYVIGDIHGRRDLLEQVLKAIDEDKARNRELGSPPRRSREAQVPPPNPPTLATASALSEGGSQHGTRATLIDVPSPSSTIGPDLTVRGRIQTKGALRIEGHISGDVHASRIVVASGASVEGAIVAADVEVAGSVEGTIRGINLKFGKGASVKADVLHTSLSVEEGCHYEGRAIQIDDPLSERYAGSLLGLQEPPEVEVYLGDYIDRGEDSRGVIDLLIQRARKVTAVFVRGNHEQFLLDFLAGTLDFAIWKQVGALATLLSYGISPGDAVSAKSQTALRVTLDEALTDAHARFFADTVPYLEAGPYLFVHAGLRPGIPLAQQRPEDLMGIRRAFLEYEGDFGRTVVHGHTPSREVEFKHNRINLDTGAYSSGRLTCLRIGADGPRVLKV